MRMCFGEPAVWHREGGSMQTMGVYTAFETTNHAPTISAETQHISG
jgi:hypothetical protein